MTAPAEELPAAVRDCLQYVLPAFTPPMTRDQVEGYLATNQRLINTMLHMQRERSQPNEVIRLQQHLTANLRLLAYYADKQMRTDVDHAQYADILRNRPADPFSERDVGEAMMAAASRQATAAGAWASGAKDAAAAAAAAPATAHAPAASTPVPSEREQLAEALLAGMPPHPAAPARPGPQSERIPPTAAERAASAAAASLNAGSMSAPSTSASATQVGGVRGVQ